MVLKNIYLKEKIVNHITKKGKKEISEKLFFKSLKLNQKSSLKDFNKMVKLAILHASPIITVKRLQKNKRKSKEFPFIVQKRIRMFLAINLIISYARNKRTGFTDCLNEEITNSASNNSFMLRNMNENQENHLNLKKYVYYRWLF